MAEAIYVEESLSVVFAEQRHSCRLLIAPLSKHTSRASHTGWGWTQAPPPPAVWATHTGGEWTQAPPSPAVWTTHTSGEWTKSSLTPVV